MQRRSEKTEQVYVPRPGVLVVGPGHRPGKGQLFALRRSLVVGQVAEESFE